MIKTVNLKYYSIIFDPVTFNMTKYEKTYTYEVEIIFSHYSKKWNFI